MSDLMPAIFLGHGNPMNAITQNAYTGGWAAIGGSIPRRRAILAVSAHWYIPGCGVTANVNPPTIHDFGGFPRELYEVSYPAPGSPELARRVKELLAPRERRHRKMLWLSVNRVETSIILKQNSMISGMTVCLDGSQRNMRANMLSM